MKNSSQAYIYRGAPFTFNSQKFFDDLTTARKSRSGIFPSFDHDIKDPIEKAIHLSTDHKIILVEGNYLLIEEEPWAELKKSWDHTIFINPGIDTLENRLLNRWLRHGLNSQDAKNRTLINDLPNARYVIEKSSDSDTQIF